MSTRPADELLYDSEASFRLVDSALDEFRASEEGASSEEAQGEESPRLGLEALPHVLLRAYAEIMSVHENLKHSRGILERAAVEKIQQTNAKLQEVTSATEVAATDIMDGLDRALAMVDELEGTEDPDQAGEVRSRMRDELFGLMGCLQFQDITTQQINYASSMLLEMEGRLAEIAKMFDPRSFGLQPLPVQPSQKGPVAFDPAATTEDAGARQALVDEIFGK